MFPEIFQEDFELFEFFVGFDSEDLENDRNFFLTAMEVEKDFFELSCGGNQIFFPRFNDSFGEIFSAFCVVISVFDKDFRKLVERIVVHDVFGTCLTISVESHIQRRVGIDRKSPFAILEMLHIHADIQEHKIERSVLLSDFLDICIAADDGSDLFFSLIGEFKSFFHHGFVKVAGDDF